MSESFGDGTPQLKFADKHVGPILKGQKTVTLRLELDGDYSIGKRIQLVDTDGERFASAIVHDRGYTTASMAAKMSFDGHREYRDTEDLLGEFAEYYPDADMNEHTKLEIVEWDYEELWE